MLAFDRLIRHGRSRDAVLLGLAVLCAALTSGYLVVFVTGALGGALVARAPELRPGVLLRLTAAAVVTLSAGLALLSPYLASQGARPLAPDVPDIETAMFSYVSTAATPHYELWSNTVWHDRGALFPGVLALVLAGVALRASGAPRGVRRMLVAVAAVAGLLSLGPLTPVYEWAYHLIPPFQTLRAPSRFGILAVFAVAALAGIGFAALRARWRGWAPVVTAAALAAVTVESLHAPIPYRPVDYDAPVHHALAAFGPGAILELPLAWGGGGAHRNAWYLLASTNHWRSMVAGYGNVRPRGFDDLAAVLATFPSDRAVARLRALDVPYVIVHTSRYPDRGESQLRMARGRPDVTLVAEAEDGRLFRIHPARPIVTPRALVLR